MNSVLVVSSLTVFTLFGLVVGVSVKINNRPIIGILAQATKHASADTFIPATYVKYLEQAGARVVPIRTKESDEYYKKLFSHINGALFPGGDVGIQVSWYAKAGRQIYDLAVKANDKGDYFPLWGTCQGFQLLTNLTARAKLLKATDAEDLALPLNLSNDYKSSRLMGNLPADIHHSLTTLPVTYNAHHWGIWQETFEKTSSLNSFYRVLSTNKGRKQISFISTMEAYKYPFYGSQWHPEANIFLWNPKEHMDHEFAAIKVSQYFADFFVNEARKSSHTFPSITMESSHMIENFKRVYSNDGSFELLYMFNYTNTF
ncbi:gamma-glutamyl hydrolase A-like isoform X2 [Gigantopelta aegis]|uniref:gamma-glutamyl hydrolase A-like isoform X2 n=1 Tax=Gigantopelta aegis TaxID=1735272 RepID=UPI001B889B0F|nr:gamma-glutamyl hydrolase A-like isoform X2 [Gigantopelta aegis]